MRKKNILINSKVTIIIPCCNIDYFVDLCVKECLRRLPGVRIIVVSNDGVTKESKYPKNVSLFFLKESNMSFKRNRGVEQADREFIAFIDSDAYPHLDWLKNAVTLLQQNKNIGAVGGVMMPFSPNGSLERRAVGNALKSFLISGLDTYRRRIASDRYSKKLASCNLVMKRKSYLSLGGMNEELYIGEDRELCHRIVKKGKKLLYASNVIVFHKSPTLLGLFWQRLSWGMSELAIIRHIKGVDVDSFCYISSALLFLFLLIGMVLLFLFPVWRNVYWIISISFLGISVEESFRVSCNIREIPIIFLALLIGSLVPGLGIILKILRLPINIKKIYKLKK
jgi:GT2 family glycosyltransferase